MMGFLLSGLTIIIVVFGKCYRNHCFYDMG